MLWYLPIMGDTIQIDRAGRVVLPKAVRDRFRLSGGDMLAIEMKEDAIELRPQKTGIALKKVNGILVVSGAKFTEDCDFVAADREERIQELLRRGGFER
jgi:AbrB family looped-hinge helix DNA binding protein